MAVSKTVKERVWNALTTDFFETEYTLMSKLRIPRSDVHAALEALEREGRADCTYKKSHNKTKSHAKWRKIIKGDNATPAKTISFVPPSAKYEPVLKPGSDTAILYDKLCQYGEFTQTSRSLQKVLPRLTHISAKLSYLRDKGLVEALQRPGHSFLYWKAHPLSKPLSPPQAPHKPPKATRPMAEPKPDNVVPISDEERSEIDEIIDRILDDMVALKDAVSKLQASCPSAKTLLLIQQLAEKELNK